MDKEERNIYMKRYHQERMMVDAEYAARVRLNARKRRIKFSEKGGYKLYWQKIKAEQSIKKVIYYQENKVRIAEYNKARKENRNEIRRARYSNPIEKIKNNIRCLITNGIKKAGYTKTSKLTAILGCNFEFFKQYIEHQFTEGMAWKTIHCDHIIPISIAKTEQQVLQLSHYSNFRPCQPIENLRKSAKIDLALIERHGLTDLFNKVITT